MGVLYILDEPSIGLHQRDNAKLISTLCRLRDLGNTLIVVEHDEETMRNADYIVDMGPGAGVHGGHIVAEGSPTEIMANKRSLTGKYLWGELKIEVPRPRKPVDFMSSQAQRKTTSKTSHSSFLWACYGSHRRFRFRQKYTDEPHCYSSAAGNVR